MTLPTIGVACFVLIAFTSTTRAETTSSEYRISELTKCFALGIMLLDYHRAAINKHKSFGRGDGFRALIHTYR